MDWWFPAIGFSFLGCVLISRSIYLSYRTYRRTNGKHVTDALSFKMFFFGLLWLLAGVLMLMEKFGIS